MEKNLWKNRMNWMKTVWMAVFLVLSSSFFVACSETDGDSVDEYADWQSKNETYFSSILKKAKSDTSGDWMVLTKWSVNESAAKDVDHIVVEILEDGTGSGSPLYTDSVRIHYRGNLIPSVSYPSGYEFDSSYTGELNTETAVPAKGGVSSFVDGFSTALQHMNIGDYWRVYIPYQLGYGSIVKTGIPAYSTLIFYIYLDSYYHVGQTVPDWQAKQIGWIEE